MSCLEHAPKAVEGSALHSSPVLNVLPLKNEHEKIGEPGFGPMWYPKIQLSLKYPQNHHIKGRFMALSFPHRSKLGLEIRVKLTNIGDNYVHTHSRSHPPCFTGKSSRNGSFSMAMPQYQRVPTNKPMITSKGEMRGTATH